MIKQAEYVRFRLRIARARRRSPGQQETQTVQSLFQGLQEAQSRVRTQLCDSSVLFISPRLSDSENEVESEEDDSNPYPYEGKFIDEADRLRFV